MKRISIIGLGYVGLPLLCAIASSKKYKVNGFDLDEKKVKKINKRICPIDDDRCKKDLEKITFRVSTSEQILKDSDYFIICVPTPIHDDYTPDYTPVENATKTISKFLKKGNVLILESTVNPGTCEEIIAPLIEKETKLKAGKDYILGHCPERINPGDPKWNVYNIARNVGTLPENKAKSISKFYESFLDAEVNPVSSLKVAEATKIVENTFRDVNIAFVNELAQSFDKLGIDVFETIRAASNKPFAFMAHWPGCGVGGHCIAVDPYYLIKRATQSGFNHRFLKAAREVNNGMPDYTISLLVNELNKVKLSVKGTHIALLGLSYKGNVGDLRESPALIIMEKLKGLGAILHTFDPYVPERSNELSLRQAISKSSAIVLCTNHKEFVDGKIEKLLKNSTIKVVVDGRNTLDKTKIEELGILYKGIGR